MSKRITLSILIAILIGLSFAQKEKEFKLKDGTILKGIVGWSTLSHSLVA